MQNRYWITTKNIAVRCTLVFHQLHLFYKY